MGGGGDISVKCLVLFWDWPPCGFPVTSDLTPNTPEASVGSSRPVPVLEKALSRASRPLLLVFRTCVAFCEVKTVVVGISFVKAAGGAERGAGETLDPSELQGRPPNVFVGL